MRIGYRIALLFALIFALASLARAQAPAPGFEYRFTPDEADPPLIRTVQVVQSTRELASAPTPATAVVSTVAPGCSTGQCVAPAPVVAHHARHGSGCCSPMCMSQVAPCYRVVVVRHGWRPGALLRRVLCCR